MRAVLLVFSMLLIGLSFGQSDSTKTGEIISGEITIEKEKKIDLSKKLKPFIGLPFRDFKSDPLSVNFSKYVPFLEWPDYEIETKPLEINRQFKAPLYQNYLKVGFGNYTSPLLEAGVYHSVNKIDMNSFIFYESFNSGAINDENSASSRAKLKLDAQIPLGFSSELIPYIDLKSSRYRFYGSTEIPSNFPGEPLDKVGYNDTEIGAKFTESRETFDYEIDVQAKLTNQRIIGDESINKENGILLEGLLNYDVLNEYTTNLGLNFNATSYDGAGLDYGRSFFSLEPSIGKLIADISWEAGFQVASTNSDETNQVGFYPSASITKETATDWFITAFFNSSQDWNDLSYFLNQNQFLDDSLNLLFQQTNWQVGMKVSRNFSDFDLSASLSFSDIENLPLHVPSIGDSSRYTLIYDNTTHLNFKLNADYRPSRYNTYGMMINVNSYSMENLEEAWHLPTYSIKLSSSHTIRESFLAEAYLLFMGGLKAPVNIMEETSTSIDPILDMGITLSYLVNNRSSVFVSVDNLTGNEYERYLGYPVRGLSFKFGLKYRF